MSAERHPDADLVRAHFDQVSHYSVNANGGEDERRAAEDSEKQQGRNAAPEIGGPSVRRPS